MKPTLFYSTCFAVLLLSGNALPGQVSTRESREEILDEAVRVLNHPGERESFDPDIYLNFFYPEFIMDMAPTEEEILEAARDSLRVRGVMQMGARSLVSLAEHGNIRAGQTFPFTHEEETYDIQVDEIASSSFRLTLNDVTLTVNF